MKGISYLTDEEGHKKAVVIDLETYKDQIDEVLQQLFAGIDSGESDELIFQKLDPAQYKTQIDFGIREEASSIRPFTHISDVAQFVREKREADWR